MVLRCAVISMRGTRGAALNMHMRSEIGMVASPADALFRYEV